jgi:aminoglycoside phosphotransferase (APT) family kinase protein
MPSDAASTTSNDAAFVDGARNVRAGEELNADTLIPWLKEHVGSGEDLEVEQFGGGHSNLTYLLRWGGKELVLRRPPVGSKVKSAHDMAREWKVMSALHPHWPKVPTPVAFCDDEGVLGCDFYVTERQQGLILRKNPPEGLDLGEARMRAMSEALVDTLVDLHTLDPVAVGLGDLGRPEGFVQRQVEGWTKRYHGSKTDDVPVVDKVSAWLHGHLPTSPAPTLIHNDYKFDNVMFAPDEEATITCVFDWEMSTVGDPLMDLGTVLCYWVEQDDPPPLQQARMVPTHLPGCLTRRQVAERYADKSGRNLDELVFYTAFGLFKTAVVCQQIYFRFTQGLTQDPRFAAMGLFASLLCERADHVITSGEI